VVVGEQALRVPRIRTDPRIPHAVQRQANALPRKPRAVDEGQRLAADDGSVIIDGGDQAIGDGLILAPECLKAETSAENLFYLVGELSVVTDLTVGMGEKLKECRPFLNMEEGVQLQLWNP